MKAPLDNLIRSAGAASALAFRRAEGDDDTAGDEGDGRLMVGYPIVFDQWTEIDSMREGHFLERITRGAADRTIEQRAGKIAVAFNHGMDPQVGDKPLGKPTVIEPRDFGLWTETPLSATSYNDDLLALIRDGALWGQSFRFSVLGEDWEDNPQRSEWNPRGIPQRSITELVLHEFGPVTYPAYQATTLGIRTQLAYVRWLQDRTQVPGIADPGTADVDQSPTPAPVTKARVAAILRSDIA